MPHPSARPAVKALLSLYLVAGVFANPSHAAATDNEARLIGAWQKDLSPQLSQLAPERRQAAARAGLLGAVVVYRADHRLDMYPPCGAKREALGALGLQSVSGSWALSETNELVLSVNMMGQSHDIRASLQWLDGQMVVRGLDNGSLDKFGKYDGPLPPPC